jgi:hypothetical protein
MAELLAVVTLSETSLGSVRLYPVYSTAKVRQSEYLAGFLGKVSRKRGVFTVVVLSVGDRRVAEICLMLIISKPRFTSPSEIFSGGAVNGRCRITALIGFWDLG